MPAASARSCFAAGIVVSICDSPAFLRPILEESDDSDPDGLGCARGLRSAFLLETFMFVIIYAIWHLWHLAR